MIEIKELHTKNYIRNVDKNSGKLLGKY